MRPRIAAGATAIGIAISLAGCGLGAPPPPNDAGRDAPVELVDAPGDQSYVAEGADGITYCPPEEAPILAGEAFYAEASEPVEELPGPLGELCGVPSPGGRDYCFWLRDIPVYAGSDAGKQKLRPYVGFDVVIRGKRIVSSGFRPEIWPGSIRCL